MSDSTFALDICEEHAVDASFLWLYRDQGVRSPNYGAQDVAAIDERIEAHLDGLRLAGDSGWRAAEENLQWRQPGEIFTATTMAFSLGKKRHIDKVMEAGAASLQVARGAISGIAWIRDRDIAPFIKSYLQSKEPMVRRIGIGTCGALRKDIGEMLSQLLRDDSPLVCARALKAAGEIGRVDLLESCLPHLQGDDQEVQFWAAWSSALLGDLGGSTLALKKIAQSGGPHAERACDLAGRNMNLGAAQEWLQQLGANPQNLRLAIILSSAIGMPVLVSWLINMMTLPALARKAGEAFTTITGADLVEQELAGDEPEGFEAGPTEDPADELVQMDADEDLPWPDVDRIAKWWAAHKELFTPHQRYLLGEPISKPSLEHVLTQGKQTQRHAAALELALLEPGHPLFQVQARTV